MNARKFFLILSLIAVALFAFGCSKTPVESQMSSGEPNMSEEFGGYQATDETPGFGDDELLAAASESEEEYDDPYLVNSDLDSILKDPNAGHYHLRVIWGRLRYDSTSTAPTDWSGSLSVNHGVEILRRVIRFERNQDYIEPRKDRKLIEWVSKTTVHNDGIAVDIFVPPVRPLIDTSRIVQVDSVGNEVVIIVVDTTWPVVEPVTVDFKTSPYSRSFELSELMALDTIVYLDDSNAVCFQAIKLDRFPCPQGFLAGGWGFTADEEGLFRGVWMDQHGRVDGYLKGHFGINDQGKKLFFGKWVTSTGRFEGFIRGEWDLLAYTTDLESARRRPFGIFKGHIYASNRSVIGVMGGHFFLRDLVSTPAIGYFQGRWKIYCATDVTADADEGF